MDDIIMGYLDDEVTPSTTPQPQPQVTNDQLLLTQASALSSTLKSLQSAPLSQSASRLLVLSLRQVNRALQGRVVEQRRALQSFKGGIDELKAKLDSCQFEKQHLFAQAQKCLTVKTVYDSVPLEVPLSGTEDHPTIINRLQGELAHRKELQARLLAVLQRKLDTEEALVGKVKKFEELKHQLHQLIKASKTVVDLCQFQVGAKDEAEVTAVAAAAQETDKFNLPALYDQLTSFVTEHSNYKLRFVEGDDEEREAEEQASISFTVPFIQLHLLEVEAELFISRNQLNINHASLSSPQQSESFLRDLIEEDVSLESAEEIESFLQVIEGGVKQRVHLMSMIDALMIPEGISLALSPIEANTIVMQSTTTTTDITAKIDWTAGSVIWSSPSDTAVLEEVNAIALKYRSVSDCLTSQLEVLFSNLK